MTIRQLWSILRGLRTDFSWMNASWTYYPDGDPMGRKQAERRVAREFHQIHECEGYRAKVTIEWSMPAHIDGDLLPAWRKEYAEQIADSILAFSGKQMRDMVQAMRGYTPKTLNAAPLPAGERDPA